MGTPALPQRLHGKKLKIQSDPGAKTYSRKKTEKRKNPSGGKSAWLRSGDLYESLDDLKRRRPLVQPNSNFMRQLVKWENDVSKTDIEDYNPYDFFSYQVCWPNSGPGL